MLIEAFGHKILRLLEDDLVHIWQVARIKPDGVLHQQNGLDANFPYVVVDIHLILDKLDDGK